MQNYFVRIAKQLFSPSEKPIFKQYQDQKNSELKTIFQFISIMFIISDLISIIILNLYPENGTMYSNSYWISMFCAILELISCIIGLIFIRKFQFILNFYGIICPILISFVAMLKVEENLKSNSGMMTILSLATLLVIILYVEFISRPLISLIIHSGCLAYLLIRIIMNSNFVKENFDCLSFLIISSLTYQFIKIHKERNAEKYFVNYQMQLNQIEIWKHIILDIFPGITALINVSKRKTTKNILSKMPNENLQLPQIQWELSKISNQGKMQYGVNDNSSFITFLKSIKMSQTLNYESCINSLFENSYQSITLYDVLNSQIDKQSLLECQHPSDLDVLKFKGVREESQEKFQILICTFYWNKKLQFFLKLENISIEDQLIQLQELNDAKNKILANITHDLKNPLNVVMELIKSSIGCKNSEKRNEMLEFALVNSELLMSLIYDILDNAQLQENKIKINLEEFNLIKTINEVINLMKVQTKLKKIHLDFINLLRINDYQIATDQKRLKQILINIIGNAVKFTNTGFVELRVSQEKSNFVKFEIIDSGSGIKQEVIPKLTQPFATFGNELESNINGVGLGLNFCKEIIGLLGPVAEIFISSIYGKGSKFGFLISNKNDILRKNEENNAGMILEQNMILSERNGGDVINIYQIFEPFSDQIGENFEANEFSQRFDVPKNNVERYSHQVNFQSKLEDIEQCNMSHINSECSFRNKKLNKKRKINALLVDDSAFNILVLRNQLEKYEEIEFTYFEAFNGQQAVDIFKEKNVILSQNENIKLIFMDCNMPLKNGYDAALEIKTLIETNNFEDTIIVALSAYSSNEDTQKCFDHKMNLVLSKPLTFEILKKVLNDFICSDLIFDN